LHEYRNKITYNKRFLFGGNYMNKKISIVAAVALSLVLMGCSTTKQTQVKDYEFTESVISISNGVYDIPATLVMPIADMDVPLVIMLHGTGSSRDEAGDGYKLLAPELAKKGIASIRYDFPGSGDSTVSYLLYCNTEASENTLTVADYAANLDGVDSTKLGVLGWSQGGTDALLVAGESNRFKSVATWAGALELSDMVTPEMRAEALATGQTMMEFGWRDALPLSQKWIDESDNMDVLAEVANITAPIGSFHGSEDEDVPYSDSTQVQAASTNPNSELITIEGTGHTYGIFSGDMSKFNELTAKTVDWFVRTL
jgi:pimeloyl-ACP methyl ester carboxylesterase